jgi:L-ribulose-5-phosphate 3-epimerase
MPHSRRTFLTGVGAMGAIAALPRAARASCPFKLSVINDEISQDFDHACYVAAHDFGLQWIELRGMWNKNITDP